MSLEEGVAAALSRLTAARIEGRWGDLGGLLHERVVLSEGDAPSRGRAAVVARHRALAEGATVDEYRETRQEIDVFGTTAVATVGWRMLRSDPAGVRRHSGRDHIVLEYDPEQGEWIVLWHAVLFDPPAAAE